MAYPRRLATLVAMVMASAVEAEATSDPPASGHPASAEAPISASAQAPAGSLTEVQVTASRIGPEDGEAVSKPADTVCGDTAGGAEWIDRMHTGLYRAVCLSAARFDGFFGNERYGDGYDEDYEKAYGRLAVGTQWDERDHWDPSIRFRVNVPLPQLSERWHAFIGRVDPDDYVSDTSDDFDALPQQFAGLNDEDSVLVGLGYRQPKRRGGYFDTSVGVDLDWPPEPYVKAGYHLAVPFLDRNLLRFNETVFWRADDDGFGSTTRVDVERLLNKDLLLRWTGGGTVSQDTEGFDWFSNVTLFQKLGAARAFAYQVGVSGETDREVPIKDYGLRVIFRRKIHREWLFLELRSSVTWPRETLLEPRKPNWGAGVALELQFGERQRR
jgi:hypothetical protein